MPKQFLDILGTGKSLIRQTFERMQGLCAPEHVLVVTNAAYKDLVLEHIPEIAPDQVLCEPEGRNTAPCIAYASYRIAAEHSEADIVVTPSDHLITNVHEFERIIRLAVNEARTHQRLVTLGISPSRPDTGYGYIQYQDSKATVGEEVKEVMTFREKPDRATAEQFISEGNYLWNAGIFVWTLDTIQQSFRQHLPDMAKIFEDGKGHMGTSSEDGFIRENFGRCESISIDYGVMERADDVSTVVSDFGWSDLGTYGSLYTHLDTDDSGNAVVGSESALYDCSGNLVKMETEKLFVAKGLEDLIIVDTEHALMICPRSEEQFVKEIVNDLKAKGRKEYY
jgi:mannose-1-phosphate guanylyltransferase